MRYGLLKGVATGRMEGKCPKKETKDQHTYAEGDEIRIIFENKAESGKPREKEKMET